ncbi:hypothetical protein [Alcaligenes sp. SDU_A2]|uniref:hypothetical protein n=1 Tax=Alcaligenes sp. SDU_A2 TaxID=3136634 RepID=UPI00311E44BE
MNYRNDLHLTDAIERQLLTQALYEQDRLRPFAALKKLFLRLLGQGRRINA